MIGVVVWSSVDKEKAVIWCEDHAALAYLQGRENLACSAYWPQPGDLVELESDIIGQLRNARRVTLLSEQEYAHLPGLLRSSVPPAEPHLRIVASTPHPEVKDQLTAAPDLRTAAAS
jgi:hypothetical protein